MLTLGYRTHLIHHAAVNGVSHSQRILRRLPALDQRLCDLVMESGMKSWIETRVESAESGNMDWARNEIRKC